MKANYLKNEERLKQYAKEYEKTYKHIRKKRNQANRYANYKKWYQANREVYNSSRNKRRKEFWRKDKNFLLRERLRTQINQAIRFNKPNIIIHALLGCDVSYAREYLENRFEKGMSWGNYGNDKNCWVIDHIIPLSSFDLIDNNQQIKAFNYKNIQPLWAVDNMKKGAKLIRGDEKHKYTNR